MSELLDHSKVQAEEKRIVHLVSSEGESFDVPVDVAKMSAVVSEMINDEDQNDEEAQDIPLPNVKSAIRAKGKTPEEIRKTFNIVNDFTPEEEAAVREENKWCEDA
eukprot:gene32521-42131_t